MPSWIPKRKKQLPTIRLQDPLLHTNMVKGKYTTYKIVIETEHHAFHLRTSCIRRRFSELRWLNTTLQSHHRQIKLPPVPSKRILSQKFNTNFVNTRMREMEVFLNELLQIDAVLSDTALHLFLQTDLTPEEMESYLNGETSDEFLGDVWANHGHLHTPNELGTYLSIATPCHIEMDEEDEMYATSNSMTPCLSSPNKTSTSNGISRSDHTWIPAPHIPELSKNSSEDPPTDENINETTPAQNTQDNPSAKNNDNGDDANESESNSCSDDNGAIEDGSNGDNDSNINNNNDSNESDFVSIDDDSRTDNSSPSLSDEAVSVANSDSPMTGSELST